MLEQQKIKISIGEKYPERAVLEALGGNDGATFNPFVNDMPAELFINLNDITALEKSYFEGGNIKFGFIKKGMGIVCFFKVCDLYYECPVNIHRLKGKEVIPSPNKDLRLTVNMVLIESLTGVVEHLRAFTLHPKSSAELIEAVGHQLENGSLELADAHNDVIISMGSLDELARKANMRQIGV